MIKPLLFSAVMLLSACVTPEVKTRTVIERVPVDIPQLTLPPVDEVRMRDVSWIVVTRENAEEVFAQLENEGKAVVLFALTEQGYENISLNTSDALKIITQQKAVINGYERFYIKISN